MRIFLDSSVLLAACGSADGASFWLFHLAEQNGWTLLASPYVLDEVVSNIARIKSEGTGRWARLRPQLMIVDDVLTIDRAVVFPSAKDRPILFTALAWAQVLLTLDHADFETLVGSTFYGLTIMSPGAFLVSQRASKRLRE